MPMYTTYTTSVRGGKDNKRIISFEHTECDETSHWVSEGKAKSKCEYCGRYTTSEMCPSCGAPIRP